MFTRFTKNTDGNMAVMFALSLMAILMASGAAIDMAKISKNKSHFQGMADAAVLAAARSGETDKAKLLVAAKATLEGNDTDKKITSTKINFTKEGHIQVKMTASYDTVMMGMFGKSTYDIEIVAESPMPSGGPVNIALVLDVTKSMSYDKKLTTLKIAAKDLVESLNVTAKGPVSISVIPFSQYVNVGTGTRGEDWLNVKDNYSKPRSPKCKTSRKRIKGSKKCKKKWVKGTPYRPAVPKKTCYDDGVPYKCGGRKARKATKGRYKTVCSYKYGPKKKVCTPRADYKYIWKGCMGSRDMKKGWNTDVAFNGSKSNRMPGMMNRKECNQEILLLTKNKSDITGKIDSLKAKYETYIPGGLMWGWRTLDPRQPFTESNTAKKAKTKSVLILMTDGANTKSQKGTDHRGKSKKDADKLTAQLCAKIKADKIEIHTIAYDISDASTRSMISTCATNVDMFYNATDAGALKDAFSDIGDSLAKVRLSH